MADAAQAARASFLSVAVWWLVFSIPLFRRVPEPPVRVEAGEAADAPPVRLALARVSRTLRELRSYRHAFLLLLAFVLYNDGINTIIRLATSSGTEIGIPRDALITAVLLVQFVGIPFAFLFGILAGWIGAKRSIYLALVIYTTIAVLAYDMETAGDFYLLAMLVATVQGGSQALGRSLFAAMIPRHKSSEFFGFFSIFEKFGAILGPAVFTLTTLATGSSRGAILSIIAFFVSGAIALSFVNVGAGQRAAREAETETQRARRRAGA
jgi:UMF1 family MFS transporter